MQQRLAWEEHMAQLDDQRREWWVQEASNGYPSTLCEHASRGNIKKLRQVLKWKGSNVNAVDQQGWSPLMFAVEGGRPDICHLLLQKRADPCVVSLDDPDAGGNLTPLSLSAISGNEQCMKVLLDGGADVAQKYGAGWNSDGHSTLTEALCQASVGCVRTLLAAGAVPDAMSFFIGELEGQGHAHPDLAACWDLVLEAHADINARSPDGLTAMMWACDRGFPSIVRLLLESHADTSIVVGQGRDGYDALSIAISSKQTKCVQALLEHGVSATTAPDEEMYPPTTIAFVEGGLAEVQLLRAFGAPHLRPRTLRDATKQAKADWLDSVRDYAGPLHFSYYISQSRAIQLLRSGEHSIFARKSIDAPTALQIAQASPHAEDPASAAFACVQAAEWSPTSHRFFPSTARCHAIDLLLFGRRLADKHGFPFDVWLNVMRFSIEAIEPAFRFGSHALTDKRLASLISDEVVAPLAALMVCDFTCLPLTETLSLSDLTAATEALKRTRDFEATSTEMRYVSDPKYGRLWCGFNMWASEERLPYEPPMEHVTREALQGCGIRRLTRKEQAAAPKVLHERIICLGTSEYGEAGSRLNAAWEVPTRAHMGGRVLVVLQIVCEGGSESALTPETLVYSLRALSSCVLFLPVPPGRLDLNRCIQRLTVFHSDGRLLYHHANIMKEADGEIYGDSAWYMGNEDDGQPSGVTTRPFADGDKAAGVLIEF